MSDEEQRCYIEWIDGGTDKEGVEYPGCKFLGKPVQRATDELLGEMNLFIGGDFGFGEDERIHDRTAFTVIGIDPQYIRHLLWIESDHGLTGPDIVDRLQSLIKRFRPRRSAVESNGAQKWASQFVRGDRRGDSGARRASGVKIEGLFTTQASKMSKEFGVETMFTEFAQGLWRIPANADGSCTPEVQAFIDEAIAYRPGQHPGDRLMAGWIAHEIARRVTRFDLKEAGVTKEKKPAKEPGAISTSGPRGRWQGTSGYTMKRGGAF